MTLPIAQLGQPVLRQKALEVPAEEIATPEFQNFLDELLATVAAENGAGLAGPQVFASRRVFVANVLPPTAEGGAARMGVFLNPTLTATSDQRLAAWEGCLSFPELAVLVPRFEAVRLDYLDRDGRPQSLELSGWPARIAQHEYDHLEGVLTIDRAPSSRFIIKASEIEAASKELEER